jgi:hypothetical protein
MALPTSGTQEMVWELQSYASSANSQWQLGQVELTARQVTFHVVKEGAEEGWAAIDDVQGVEVVDGSGCPTVPADSAVTTTAVLPDSTTSDQGELGASRSSCKWCIL